ncbi:hypothetical protein GJAV_G00000470 [Gymnothorax javanicus]|nr:hypothetical protein GJAV_G00000470 [Gymnothorax javanicus]
MNERHTGANVAELLSSAVNEWNIAKKDIVLVTDNAANMVVAAELGHFVHLKCYAHALNLASQRVLKLPSVARLLGRVRRIAAFFHRSTIAKHQLEENQKLLKIPRHKLKIDCSTRWNSAYEMVSRFLEQQPAITATLLSPLVRRAESDLCTLSEADVTNAEDVIAALKPMKDATSAMSEESSPTISLVAPLQAKLLDETKDSTGVSTLVKEIKQAIHEDLGKKYSSEQEKQILHTAAAFDPRFKGLPFLSEEERKETYGRVAAAAAQLEPDEREDEEKTPACRGPEDHCISATEPFYAALGASVMKGCASGSFCSGLYKLTSKNYLNCCKGNMCNGGMTVGQKSEGNICDRALRIGQSILFLILLPLTSFILFS